MSRTLTIALADHAGLAWAQEQVMRFHAPLPTR